MWIFGTLAHIANMQNQNAIHHIYRLSQRARLWYYFETENRKCEGYTLIVVLGMIIVARVMLKSLNFVCPRQEGQTLQAHDDNKSHNNDCEIETWKEAFRWGSASRYRCS